MKTIPDPLLSKKKFLDMVEDLVSNFMFYDRKDDEDAHVGSIEMAIYSKVITPEELTDKFKTCLISYLEEE